MKNTGRRRFIELYLPFSAAVWVNINKFGSFTVPILRIIFSKPLYYRRNTVNTEALTSLQTLKVDSWVHLKQIFLNQNFAWNKLSGPNNRSFWTNFFLQFFFNQILLHRSMAILFWSIYIPGPKSEGGRGQTTFSQKPKTFVFGSLPQNVLRLWTFWPSIVL